MLRVKVSGGKTPVIEVAGELKPENKAEAIEALILSAEQAPTSMIVDLKAVTSFRPEMIAMMTDTARAQLGQGGRLALVVSGDEMADAVKRTGLRGPVDVRVYGSREDAQRDLAA